MALTGLKFDGDNLEMDWGGTAIEQEILREVVFSRKREMYDKTGSGEKARRKHGGKREYSMRITLWGTTRDVDLQDLFDETASSATAFMLYPNGRDVGETARAGDAWVDSIDETISTDGMTQVVINCVVDGDIWSVVAAPDAAFSWLPFDVWSNGFGTFRPEAGWNLQTHAAIAPATTYYINTATGNDGNSGLSSGLAKATWNSVVAAGNATAGAYRIIIENGSYIYRTLATTAPTQSVEVIGQGTVYLTSDHRNICSDWTLESGDVYKTTITAGNFVAMVVDESILDANENPMRYTSVASVVACQADPGSFYWVGGVLYVHCNDSRALSGNPSAGNLWLLDSLAFAVGIDSKRFYFENVTIRGGVRIRNASSTGGLKAYFKNCALDVSTQTIHGVDEYILENSENINSNTDGQNYDVYNTRVTNYVEIGFEGGENGTASDHQPSTSHNACIGVRVMGVYHDSAGQSLADVGSGTKSWNLGCDLQDPAGGVGVYTDNGTLWLHAVQTDGNVQEAGSGTIYKRNCDIGGSESGNILTY